MILFSVNEIKNLLWGEMRLSFEKGYFYLNAYGVPLKSLRDGLQQGWRLTLDSKFVTNNLAAASRYQQYSDESAQKIFKTICNEKREMPQKPLPDFLDPHQVEGVKWALTRKRSFLNHAPGAGKSLQALVVSEYTDPWAQTLIICPPTLTENWRRQIEEWIPKLIKRSFTCSSIGQSPTANSVDWNADYIICPHSMLTTPWVYNRLKKMTVGTLIVDEASTFKEYTSQRTKALYGGKHTNGKTETNFSGLVRGSHRVLLLDGSPMPNRPIELWTALYGCTPETIEYMGRQSYGLRYCGASKNVRGEWEFKYSSNEHELRERLHRDFMHTVREEALEHAARQRKIIYTTTDPRTPEMIAWEAKNLYSALEFVHNENGSQGALAAHRAQLGLKKIPFIYKYTVEKLEAGESVLLFVWHRVVALELKNLLGKYKPGLVIGGTDALEKQRAKNNFEKGKTNICIGNIRSMGVGHNQFERTDRIIFGEFSFTDEYNLQCEKRASRKGRSQDRPVLCDYLIAGNTMDEKVLRSVFSKIKRKERIFGK